LFPKRIGKTHRFAQFGAGSGIGLRVSTGDDIDDITGQQPQHEKNNDTHAEQRRYEHCQTAKNVSPQRLTPKTSEQLECSSGVRGLAQFSQGHP
jgi:hypothetical protein